MTFLASVFSGLLAVIALPGVQGERLVARAFLDANNARVGDPLILTVDFLGAADFAALHPPALAAHVDSAFWRVDDQSAKTETVDSARRLVYRVRPLREGCYAFPSLSFSYVDASTGATNMLATQELPVHVKPGAQAALALVDVESASTPQPDGLFVDLSRSPWHSGAALSADELFAWKRACAQPSEAAFAAFDFPEARLNAAACALLDGRWAKAKSFYSALEWRIGQTPAIRRGLRVAKALETGDPAAELPAWRQVLGPVLRYAWAGRLACALGGLVALVLLLAAIVRLSRFFLCLALIGSVCVVSTAQAQSSPFEEFDRMRREMDRLFENTGFGASSRFAALPAPDLSARVIPDRTPVQVGEPFAFIVSVECPKDVTLSGLTLGVSHTDGLTPLGRGHPLTDLGTADTNSIIRRVSFPVRYDAPYKGPVSFTVSGQYEQRVRRGASVFSTSRPFSLRVQTRQLEIGTLPQEGRPAGFTGIVATDLSIRPYAENPVVETNDVVTLNVTVDYKGYVPADAFPGVLRDNHRSRLVYRQYARATGAPATPALAVPYYDLRKKAYAVASAPGVALHYKAPETNAAPVRVAVNMEASAAAPAREALVGIRFAPRRDARLLGTVDPGSCTLTESAGAWVRLDDGTRAGWTPCAEYEQALKIRHAIPQDKGVHP